MKVIISGVIILVAVIAFAFFISRGDSGENKETTTSTNTSIGDEKKTEKVNKFLSLTFKDYDGNEVKLSDFSGNLIVNSWAVWCPFCVDELPTFAELQAEFEGQVTVIAIDRAESLNKVKKYSDDLGVTDSFVFLLDSSDSFYREIGGFSMPETIFVSDSGNIELHKRGPMRIDEMRRLTKESFNL